MLMQSDVGRPGSAHVIVLGNEKGGSGKSTTAMHIAVALLQAGQRVATIDLDSRQKSFTHYIEHRRDWAERARLTLDVPTHYCVARGAGLRIDEIEAHDFDVLGIVDQTTFEVTGVSHYAEMVREARRQRRLVDGGLIDWVVVRNRLSTLGSRNKRLVGDGVDQLAEKLGFRPVDGFAERVVYREFFPRGLTALDALTEDTLGQRPSPSHVTAPDAALGPAPNGLRRPTSRWKPTTCSRSSEPQGFRRP